MSDLWKNKIDEYIKKREERNQEEMARLRARREQKRESNQLAEFQERFFCHICHRPSSGPFEQPDHSEVSNPGDYLGKVTWFRGYTDWNKPGDLILCEICHQYTCFQCSRKDICRTCAAKL